MRLFSLFVVSLMLVGCSRIPHDAYKSRGGVETLLDRSSEEVSVSLDSPYALDQLIEWVDADQPSHVVLSCLPDEPVCLESQRVLEQFAVPYRIQDNGMLSATLVYDRVVARDCDPRFITNHINPYHLNHPTYGCAIASNALMMIADKQQIVAPTLSDLQSANKMVQSMDLYNLPSDDVSDFGSLLR